MPIVLAHAERGIALQQALRAVLVLFVSKLGPMFRGRQQKLAALNTVLQENIVLPCRPASDPPVPGATRTLVERRDVLGGLIHEYHRAARFGLLNPSPRGWRGRTRLPDPQAPTFSPWAVIETDSHLRQLAIRAS